MMVAVESGRLAYGPKSSTLWIATITFSRASCAGGIARITTFGCPRLLRLSWGAIFHILRALNRCRTQTPATFTLGKTKPG